MPITPFTARGLELWAAERVFPRRLTAGGWSVASCMAVLGDDFVRDAMTPGSTSNTQAAEYFRCRPRFAADLARSVLYCRGLLDELVFPGGPRLNDEELLTWCTDRSHRDGDHTPECTPPADPGNPELRLLRAIFGLCARCDRTDDHDHGPNRPEAKMERKMPKDSGSAEDRRAAQKERSGLARQDLNVKVKAMQEQRETQEKAGKSS